MSDDNYFARRAEQEDALARKATHPAAAAAHDRLSAAYLEKAASKEPRKR